MNHVNKSRSEPEKKYTSTGVDGVRSSTQDALNASHGSWFMHGDSLEELGIDDNHGRDVVEAIREFEELSSEELGLMNTAFVGRHISGILPSHVWAAFRDVRRLDSK
jgi:hypothetical protein